MSIADCEVGVKHDARLIDHRKSRWHCSESNHEDREIPLRRLVLPYRTPMKNVEATEVPIIAKVFGDERHGEIDMMKGEKR